MATIRCARPEDLEHHTLLHSTASREDWQLWLTAAGTAGIDRNAARAELRSELHGDPGGRRRTGRCARPHAASSRRTSPPGRLVVPFECRAAGAMPAIYIVAPEATADTPKIALFRDWLIGSVAPGAVAPPPP